jgi:hypothetical protein
MNSQLGQIGLISWQDRRSRRAQSGGGLSLWTVTIVLLTVTGATLLACQGLGFLHLTGVMVAAPAGLLVLAVTAQIIALIRAGLTWLAG